MSLDVTINQSDATFTADPAYGRRVTFEVVLRSVNVAKTDHYYSKRVADRYVVQLKGSTGNGFSNFTSFERACASALSRAKRYEKAYSVPRGAVLAEASAA